MNGTQFAEQDLENFVTIGGESELIVDDDAMLQQREGCDDGEVDFANNFIPTTNASEIPIEVEEKVRYGFKFVG